MSKRASIAAAFQPASRYGGCDMLNIGELALVFVASAAVSFGLLLAAAALLRASRARPSQRPLVAQNVPTPQGGGMAVIAATTGVVVAAVLLGVVRPGGHSVWLVLAATVFVALVGAVDDLHSIAVMPRLVLQVVAVAIVLAALPGDLRIVPLASLLARARA